MRQAEIPSFILLILLIAVAPFLPTRPLLILDWLVVRILAVLLLLYAVSLGPIIAVFGFMALAILYMERNRRKIQNGLQKWDAMDTANTKLATVEEAHRAQTTVRVAPFDIPDEAETDYAPQEEPMDISVFEPVAPSQNEKVVLSTSYPVGHQSSSSTTSMNSIYEQLGVGHLRQVETVGQ